MSLKKFKMEIKNTFHMQKKNISPVYISQLDAKCVDRSPWRPLAVPWQSSL